MADKTDRNQQYAAFVSYRHVDLDRKWAKWLVKKLETYRAPSKLIKKGVPQRIGTLFRDDDEIPASSDLSGQIQQALEGSEFLIVICSPDTPKSKWVRKEIETFQKLGKGDHILALLVDGEPGDSFPPELLRVRRETTRADGTIEEVWEDVEPIASDVRSRSDEKQSVTEHRALIRIAATLLRCRFDDLMQRDRQRQRQRRLLWGSVTAVVLIAALVTAWHLHQNILEKERAEVEREYAETAKRVDYLANQAAEAYRIGAFERAEGLVNEAAVLASDESLQRSVIQQVFPGLAEFRRGYLSQQSVLVRSDRKADSFVPVVFHADFSPDGSRFATASQDGTARIWDAATGIELAVLPGHEDFVTDVEFSPDGGRIVTASYDGTARLWDVFTGTEIAVLRMTESRTEAYLNAPPGRPRNLTIIPHATFSADGRFILTTSFDGPARLWDGATGSGLVALGRSQERVAYAAFSPDGSRIMTDDGQRTRLWDTNGAAVGPSYQGPGRAFSPDGRIILTISYDGAARLWEVATGGLVSVCRGYTGETTAASFTPSGPRILTLSAGNTVQVWDASSCTKLSELNGHESKVTHAAFSGHHDRVVTASWDGTARVWDLATGSELAVIRGHEREVEYATFSPDDRHIVTASSDGTARIWDVVADAEIAVLGRDTVAAEFSPDFRSIVTSSANGTARLWDSANGTDLALFKEFDDGVAPKIVFSPDKSRAVVSRLGKIASLGYDQPSYQQMRQLRHDDFVADATFSPNGRQIVTASWDGTAQVWDTSTGTKLSKFQGHEQWVTRASFSPDGRRIVTASHDHTARLWDAATGKELLVFRGHDGPLSDAAFSPDGRRIVTASYNSTARLWDAASGAELAVLRAIDPATGVALVASGDQANQAAYHAVFSPDGRYIVTSSPEDIARLWDARTGSELPGPWGRDDQVVNHASFSSDDRRIVTVSNDIEAVVWDALTGAKQVSLWGHEEALTYAAFSPDGSHLVTASRDKTARVWDANTGVQLSVLRGHENGLTYAAFTPDGLRIVTSSHDDTARIWDMHGLQRALIRRLDRNERGVHATYSSDGRRIVTRSRDKVARLWDATSGAEIAVLRGHDGSIYDATFNSNGQRVVTSSGDKTSRLWDTESGTELAVFRGHDGVVTNAAISADGNRVMTTSMDSTARLWNATTGDELAVSRAQDNAVVHAAFSSDGRRLVTTSAGGIARLWEVGNNTRSGVARKNNEPVSYVSFTPDGSFVLSASDNGTAWLWFSFSYQETAVFRGHDGRVVHAAFSGGAQGWGSTTRGKRIVTASHDKTARMWDAANGSEMTVFRGHSDRVTYVDFSPDDLQVVTASDDQTARLWDAGTGAELTVFRGHTGRVARAIFSPDGGRILTVSGDGTARMWDVATGSGLAVFRGHNGPVSSGTFSPDGRRIVTTSHDGTAILWDANTGAELAVLSGHDSAVTDAAFLADGRSIVTVGNGVAMVWDVTAGKTLKRVIGKRRTFNGQEPGPVTYAGLSQDSRHFVTADSLSVKLWDTATGYGVAVHSEPVRSVSFSFSPDSSRAVTADGSNARLWDTTTGREVAMLPKEISTVFSAVFSPDGSHIVTKSDEGITRFWDAATGDELTGQVANDPTVKDDENDHRVVTEALGENSIRVLDSAGDERFVIQIDDSGLNTPPGRSSFELDLSPDERFMITRSFGGRIRLWDAIGGVEVEAIGRGDEVLSHSGFIQDGSRVVTTSQSGGAWLWDLSNVESANIQLIRLRLGATMRMTREDREISDLPPDDLSRDLRGLSTELNPDDHVSFGRSFSLGTGGVEKDFAKALFHRAIAVIVFESLDRPSEAQQQRVLRANLARVVSTEQLLTGWSMIEGWMAENGIEEFVY